MRREKGRKCKVILCTIVFLIAIGFICSLNLSPVDVISGASEKTVGLQKSGALYHILNGVER